MRLCSVYLVPAVPADSHMVAVVSVLVSVPPVMPAGTVQVDVLMVSPSNLAFQFMTQSRTSSGSLFGHAWTEGAAATSMLPLANYHINIIA